MMTNWKSFRPFLATAALLAQALCFVGLVFMIIDLLTLPRVLFPDGDASVEQLTPYLTDTIGSYRPALGIGALGALTAWLLMLKGRYYANWFLAASRVFGWLWLPLIPAGTLFAVLLLSGRMQAVEAMQNPQQSTSTSGDRTAP